MPSLKKRVTNYFRQLSFHNEPREKRHNLNENSFITKYLHGQISLREGPPILYGKNPTDLPNFELGHYTIGCNSIVACYTGPNGGLTAVKRTEKHLSVTDPDIDFIDTQDETAARNAPGAEKPPLPPKPPKLIDNTTMVIRVAGQEYRVTAKGTKKHNKSRSLGSLSDFPTIDTRTTSSATNDNNHVTKETLNNNNINNNNDDEALNAPKQAAPGDGENLAKEARSADNRNGDDKEEEGRLVKVASTQEGSGSIAPTVTVNPAAFTATSASATTTTNYSLTKSKSEGNPFQHKKKGKIIKIAQRAATNAQAATNDGGGDDASGRLVGGGAADDAALPPEWNRKCDRVFGISESLYDRNQVTRIHNGDPIADCFGVIARNDSAILALADGVNWGEKAAIAAKSAIHGALHYLNKTVFLDTQPFEVLQHQSSESSSSGSIRCSPATTTPSRKGHQQTVMDTKEVFVCLLRAFNCAHDLILENQGMLTTLTVAVVLPLKKGTKKDTSTTADASTDTTTAPNANAVPTTYVCCVCNVGDTLAYIYSQKYGIREMTKGSHNINANRDMRDALGALGPVDGINPELSNLTLSVTTMQKGDIVLIASDGLTDNFDPNVCKFTVNSVIAEHHNKTGGSAGTPTKTRSSSKRLKDKPPLIPPSAAPPPTVAATNAGSASTRNVPPPPQKPPREKTSARRAAAAAAAGAPPSNRDSLRSRPSIDRTSIRRGSQSSIHSQYQQQDAAKKTNTPEKILSKHHKHVEDSGHRKNPDDENKNPVDSTELDNPLVAQFLKDNPVEIGSSGSGPGGPSESLLPLNKSASASAVTPSTTTSYKPTPSVRTKARRSSSHREQHQHQHNTTPSSHQQQHNRNKNSTDNSQQQPQSRIAFLRSKTTIELRRTPPIPRNEDGLPYVTPMQRYEINLLFMEDVLRRGISGRDSPCTTARKLCESLTSFAFSITAAKRRTLEDPDLYFDNRNGVMVEVSQREKKARRRRGLEKVQNLPGKLDHVSVVAYNVGFFAY